MPFFFIPDHITVGLDKETRDLVIRVLDARDQRKEIAALMQTLDVSTNSLIATVTANPDPNPND